MTLLPVNRRERNQLNSMDIKYFPSKDKVEQAMVDDDPLLLMVSHDEKIMLLANIDDVGEHIILLRTLDFSENDLDKFFRVVVNKDGADWTFVCPANYKYINNKEKRIIRFFSDGIKTIKKALSIIGYEAEVHIPKRYRRHIDFIK